MCGQPLCKDSWPKEDIVLFKARSAPSLVNHWKWVVDKMIPESEAPIPSMRLICPADWG